MRHSDHFEFLPESMVRAMQHSEIHRETAAATPQTAAKLLSIAISRQVGAGAAADGP